MIGLVGIALALIGLIYFAYRGVSVLLLAPIAALLACAFNTVPLLGALTQIFMPALGGFIVQYFLLFLLGAVFGRLMEDSGSAQALAEAIVARLGPANAIPAVVLACAVLTYGGVSLFVVAFAVFPIAAALFARADLPRRLIPATIALGAFTFTMTALPGTPAIQNAIPMPYFGTTAFAAPTLGLFAAGIMLGGGLAWIAWRSRKPGNALEQAPAAAAAELSPNIGVDQGPIGSRHAAPDARPGLLVAVTPIVLVIAANYALAAYGLSILDTAYLALPEFGAVGFDAVRGVWAIILALTLSILATIALNRSRLPALAASLGAGANAAGAPAFNTAALVGVGAVIAALPAFAIIRDAVLGLAPGNPLISLAVSVNVLAGVTGSASGGMSIALSSLGETYLARGAAAGISPEVMHRVTTIATGGLDALPHNGAVVTLLSVCGLTHREAYKDIFVVACLIPIIALAAVIALTTWTGVA